MVLRKNAKALEQRARLKALDDETVIVDLKKVRFPKADYELLRSLKKSGTSEKSTYAPLVRYLVRMGLTLHRHGIHTVEQLEEKLKQLSGTELQALEERIIQRVTATLEKKKTAKPKS